MKRMGTDRSTSASDSSSPEVESSSSSTGQQRRKVRSGPSNQVKKQKTQAVESKIEEEVVEAEAESGQEDDKDIEEEDELEKGTAAYDEHVYTILKLALPSGSVVTEDALERVSRAFGAIIKEVSASAAATVADMSRDSTLHRTVRQPLKKKGKVPKSINTKEVKSKKVKDIEPSEEKYEVEAITEHYTTPGGRYRFLIKWKGYPQSQNTWEPLSALAGCQALLAAYSKRKNIII